MLNLSLKELELKAKNRGIKDYKSMPIDKLLSILDKLEQVRKTKAIRDIRKQHFNNDKMLKSIRELFRPEKDKGINDKVLKDIRSLYGLKIKKGIYDKVLKDITTLYKSDKEDCYKQITIGNAFSSNYIEYESNGDKDKTSIKEYLDEIKPYLNNLKDNHKTQGERKIQLTMAINIFSSKDSNETRTMLVL